MAVCTTGEARLPKYFASRGARLDVEGAAGVGRLDIVRTFFDEHGGLKPPATEQQLKDGFAWACEFGRTSVVEYLLERVSGVGVDLRLKHDGQTGLHWAAYGGQVDIVRLLLERGAPVDVRDKTYSGTPLEWALHAWREGGEREADGQSHQSDAYYDVVALLVKAGGKLDADWYGDDPDRQRAWKKLHSDTQMLRAPEGKTTRDK